MSSLADQLRNRHLGTDAEDSSAVAAGGDRFGLDSAPSVQGRSNAAASLIIADLPQLGSGGSGAGGSLRSSGSPKKWGPPLSSSSSSNGSSHAGSSNTSAGSSAGGSSSGSAGSAPGQKSLDSGPKINTAKSSIQTVSLEVPDEKSAVLEAVRAVMNEQGVKIEIANSVAPGRASFMIKGKSAAAVQEALGQLEARLQPREKVEVTIPSSARAALIGSRGSTLRGLEKNHNVHIELTPISSESPWSVERTLVTIEGSAASAAAVRDHVLDIINQSRQTTSSRALTEEAALVLAQHNEWGASVRPSKKQITLYGAYNQVLEDMAKVDQLLDAIQSKYVRKPLDQPDLTNDEVTAASAKRRLPEELLQDIYNKTGSVVTPAKNEVIGPAESIDAAIKNLSKYLKSQTYTRLDIAQAHGRDGSHARMLARYFAARGEIARIAAENDGVYISPEPEIDQNSVTYTFTGEEKAASRARASLKKAVNAHSPSSMCVIRGMRHPLVRSKAVESLKTLKGPIAGLIGPSDELFLEYQEPEDDFAPSEDDIIAHINSAREHLAPLSELANSLIKRKIALKEADARLAVKPVGAAANEIFDQYIKQRDDIEIELLEGSDEKSAIVLNGTKAAVDEAAEQLPTIINLSKLHALKASHVEELNIDPKLVRNLIGRGGSQIQKFRDQYDAKVEVDEAGHVRIQGVEEQAKACMKAISDFQRRLRDEVTENLQIPIVFHAKLIGPRGKHVKRLSEQHNCLIKFPKSHVDSVESSSTADSNEADPANGAASDDISRSEEDEEGTILIRGPSRGVAAIRREFLDLVNYERSQSYSETMSVPGAVVSRLVGRGGVSINSIRQSTGAHIDVGTASSDDADVEIVAKGEQRAVKSAISQLRKLADAALDHTEVVLDIPQKHHRFITGPQNSKRRELVAAAGGDPEIANRLLSVPPANSSRNPTLIRLSGPSSVVSKLQSLIQDLVDENERRSKVSSEFKIPRNRVRRVIGMGGSMVKEIEDKYDVMVDVPHGRGAENDTVMITVNGASKDSVDSAIDRLRELALPEDLVVKIRSSLWRPKLNQQLSSKFKVSLAPVNSEAADRAMNYTPPKPQDSDFLIVPSSDLEVRISSKTAKEGQDAAKYLEELSKTDTLGFLWISPEQIPAVVGAGGKSIRKIRSDSGCAINVPHSSSSQPLTIQGAKKDVEAAREAILQAASKRKTE